MRVKDIPWEKLKYIGRGTRTVVFGYRHYAIKVGYITPSDIRKYRQGVAAGYSPPLYDYAFDIRPPRHICDQLKQHTEFADQYISDGMANVMVVARAQPAITNKTLDCDLDEIDTLVDRLQEELRQKGIRWGDDHSGNIGYYRNRLVVLDW